MSEGQISATLGGMAILSIGPILSEVPTTMKGSAMTTHVLDRGRHATHTGTDFEYRVEQMRPRVYTQARRMVGSRSDAEDITQETFVRAWTHYPRYDPSR